MKSSILTTHEKYEGSISLIRKTRNLRRPSRMLVRIWKHQLLPLCPAKFSRAIRIVGVVHPTKFKTKLACILEASESTRLCTEESLPNHHEDHIAGKGDNSLQHCNLAHKFILMLQAMKIPAAKTAVDKEWEKLEKIPAWNLTKVRSKKELMMVGCVSCAFVFVASRTTSEPVPHWRLYKVDSDSRMPSQPLCNPAHVIRVVTVSSQKATTFWRRAWSWTRVKCNGTKAPLHGPLLSWSLPCRISSLCGQGSMAHRSLVGVALVVARRPDLASPRGRARFAVIEGEWLFRRRGQSNVTCWDTSYRHTPPQAWQSLTARFPQFWSFVGFVAPWCTLQLPRATYLLRVLQPELVETFAVSHHVGLGSLSRPERRHASYIYDAPCPGKERTPQRLQHEAFRIRGTLGRMPACGKRHQEVAEGWKEVLFART